MEIATAHGLGEHGAAPASGPPSQGDLDKLLRDLEARELMLRGEG